MERLFHEYVGITPKKLSNLIRYQFLWRDILCELDFDVLSVVHKYGYTDQSHLLREFKRYHVLHNACIVDGVKVNMMSAIDIMVESLKRIILDASTEKLKLPMILPIESMEGITE